MEPKIFQIVTSESIIAWTGRKVTGFQNGTIAIESGDLNVNEGNITPGCKLYIPGIFLIDF